MRIIPVNLSLDEIKALKNAIIAQHHSLSEGWRILTLHSTQNTAVNILENQITLIREIDLYLSEILEVEQKRSRPDASQK